MKLFTFNFILFICLLVFAQNAQAQATLSIQGVLQNFNGSAVDNGQYDITFRLYTTDAGGTALWSETQTVTVTGGVYSVLLGEVNPLTVPFDQPYYVGLTIPGGPEHTPRTRLTAAPYALSMQGQDNKFPSTGLVQMGSVATGTDITTATSYTVGANDHVIYLDHTANQNVTLPAATTVNTGRQLLLVNKEAVAKTLTASNYVDLAGATSTTIPAKGVVELQSDGSVWRQTGGYVTPVAQAKAYVALTGTNGDTYPNGGVWSTIKFTETQDAQNCFASNTFTAPRTGFYRLSGKLTGSYNSLINQNFGMLIRCAGTCSVGVANRILISNLIGPSSEHHSYISADIYMTAGQTLSLQVLQSFASSIYFHATDQSCFLSLLEQ
jgi:hypothetical protein